MKVYTLTKNNELVVAGNSMKAMLETIEQYHAQMGGVESSSKVVKDIIADVRRTVVKEGKASNVPFSNAWGITELDDYTITSW